MVGVCELVGDVLAGEPWLDRVPAHRHRGDHRGDGDGWVLTDAPGLAAHRPGVDAQRRGRHAARRIGRPAGHRRVEWTPRGVVPLTVFLDDRTIDIGPRADPSFVSAA